MTAYHTCIRHEDKILLPHRKLQMTMLSDLSDVSDQCAETLQGLLVCLDQQLLDTLVHDLPCQHPDLVQFPDKADVAE